jgi:predicted phosphodiesterase
MLQSEKAARIAVQPLSDPIIKAQYPGADLYELAAELTTKTGIGWTVGQVHNRALRLSLHRVVDQRTLPPALGKARPPRVVTAERMMLCSDPHIPYHDRDLIADMMRVGKRDKCDTLVIAGDLTDAGAFSKFDRDAPTATWEQETKAASSILYELAQTFAHVHILPGNHDYRILKRLQGEVTWGNIIAGWDVWETLSDGGRPGVSDIPLIYLDDWGLVCHPDEYNRTAGSVASRLAAIYHRDIYTGHEHGLNQRWDVSGKYLCVGLGCLCRPDLVDYKTMHVTTHPIWNPGFVTVIGRQPILYAKGRYAV